MKRRIKKNKTKKLGRMAAPQKNQKRLVPLEKPLKMTDMCSPLTYDVIQQTVKCNRRRIRKRRTVPTRRLRRDKKRRKRRD
jgi:hypothetical protein